MSRMVTLASTLLGVALLVSAPARAADTMKLLPDDTEAVVSIQVRQVLDSALIKKYGLVTAKELLKGEADVQKTLNDLGFDPFRDLESVLIASPGGSAPDKGLIVVSGKFDLGRFRAKAEEIAKNMPSSLKVEKEGALTLYKITSPDMSLYAALADQETILVAQTREYLVEGLEKFAGKRTSALKSKTLPGLLAKVDQKQSVWLVAPGSAIPVDLPLDNEKLKKTLQGIESIVGGVNVTDEIKFKFLVAAKDVDAAKALVRTINDGINVGKIFLGGLGGPLAPVTDVLGAIKTTAKEKLVTVECTVPQDVIDKIRQAQ